MGAAQSHEKAKQHLKEMRSIFREFDESEKGTVDMEEFVSALERPVLVDRLAAMDLDAGDATMLFELLDNGDGMLTFDEIVSGVSRLQGKARSIDLAAMARRLAGFEY